MPATNLAIAVPSDGPELPDPRAHRGRPDLTVSDHSFFGDAKWHLPAETAGRGNGFIVLNWALVQPDETQLDDVEWAALIHMAKWFVYSIMRVNERGTLKNESLPTLHNGLAYLVRWMANTDKRSFSELDPAASDDFKEHLRVDKGNLADTPRVLETVHQYVDVLCRIHQQQRNLNHIPGAQMTLHPFGGRRASDVAADISTPGTGWIKPVPDGVWLPTVRTAISWLEGPASNVILMGNVLAGMGAMAQPAPSDGGEILAALRGADADGSLVEWVLAEARVRRPQATPGELTRNWLMRLTYRTLLKDLRDACTILIQGMLGLRISEVAGLRAEPVDEATGWPACLEVRSSRTGLNDIFYVHGHVFKGQPRPKPTEWVAGSRPRGTEHLPSVVRAMIVLEEAFRPWRRLGNKRGLLVSLGTVTGDHVRADDVRPVDSGALADGQVHFLRRRVELPRQHRAWKISTHQWRKSFAIYMVKSDERLLAAVSDHFKHLNIAVTEQGYVGSDGRHMKLVEDAGVRTAARTLFEAVHGRTAVAGKMAEPIAARAPALLAACGTEGTEEDRIERLADMLREDDVRVWPSEWGRCLFRAETARCHHQAKGEFDLSARRPLYGHRYPNICCDCSNLLISEVHGDFWRERHAENQQVLDEAVQSGDQASAAVATQRVRTSAAIMRKLDAAIARKEQELQDA